MINGLTIFEQLLVCSMAVNVLLVVGIMIISKEYESLSEESDSFDSLMNDYADAAESAREAADKGVYAVLNGKPSKEFYCTLSRIRSIADKVSGSSINDISSFPVPDYIAETAFPNVERFATNITYDSEELELLRKRALDHIAEGNYSECLRVCTDILSVMPQNNEFLGARSIVLYAFGLYKTAVKDLVLIHGSAPENMSFHLRKLLADCLLKCRKIEEALYHIDIAIKQNPKDKEAIRIKTAICSEFIRLLPGEEKELFKQIRDAYNKYLKTVSTGKIAGMISGLPNVAETAMKNGVSI